MIVRRPQKAKPMFATMMVVKMPVKIVEVVEHVAEPVLDLFEPFVDLLETLVHPLEALIDVFKGNYITQVAPYRIPASLKQQSKR